MQADFHHGLPRIVGVSSVTKGLGAAVLALGIVLLLLSSAPTRLEFTYVHANVDIDGQTFENVGVRYKGNGTFVRARGGKTPFKVDLSGQQEATWFERPARCC